MPATVKPQDTPFHQREPVRRKAQMHMRPEERPAPSISPVPNSSADLANALPELDPHDKYTMGQYAAQLEQQSIDAFINERAEELAQYDTPRNLRLMKSWCAEHSVPVTLRNLSVAMMDLIHRNQLDFIPPEIQAAEDFTDACPDWQNYNCRKNCDALEGYLKRKNLPITALNLVDGFEYLVRTKAIRPNDLGLPVVRIPSVSDLERSARDSDGYRAARALDDGTPSDSKNATRRGISAALQQAYGRSLRQAREERGGATPQEIRYARHVEQHEPKSL